ncbi:MAG TPA: FKBP-type peptidyl-prolyl cis-trans isomerase, partial [Nakamurella sp.]|nr:FKBP-type peptidyl-prolyl cis-trans isomerase [Nakamurella sp.]
KSHDWLQVNYLGQVWGGKVFDNSYDRGSLFSFQVDATPQPQVVAGWDYGLRGVKQGSRVMLSFPPQDGYGTTGNPPDISGTDTLIFVVDVVKVIGENAGGQADAAPQSVPDGLPTVTGDLGKEPKLTVPSGMAEPTADKVVVLAKGTGEPAAAGNVLVQYVAETWDGSETEKSWPDASGADATAGTGPRSLPLTTDSPFASLIGVPIGSRVLLLMKADSSTGNPALAWVIDLVLQTDVTPATSSSAAASGTNPPPTAPTS